MKMVSPAPELCLYKTMSWTKELFEPRVVGRVGMYVCGVTAYDFSHIGHTRVYVTCDVLYRYLQHLNYEFFYARNFTDVDDKGKQQQKRMESIFAIEKEIRNSLTVLGFMPSSYNEVLLQLREKALKRAGLTEEEVLQKIEDRSSARKNKQYERSDEIRKELAAVGTAPMDGPKGTTWRPDIHLDVQEKIALS